MRVLVACEYSGTVRDAFRRAGHDAYSCDTEPDERGSPYHLQCDARELLTDGWHMLIAHPPCTYLANSGVRWLGERPERVASMRAAAALFGAFLHAPIERVCVENPIIHRYAKAAIPGYRPYTQIVHPWQHGHGESKATCLWLAGLPPLFPTRVMARREQRIWRMPPGPARSRERSRTYAGIADAMAQQWG